MGVPSLSWALRGLTIAGLLLGHPLLGRAAINANESSTSINLQTEGFSVHFNKSTSVIDKLFLDGQDLLGPTTPSLGIHYVDCVCTPSGTYQFGQTTPSSRLIQGIDSTGTSYAGIELNDTYTPTGQFFQQYWFMRDGETGLHGFTRVAYYNETMPFLVDFQELRWLFRSNTELWTHLVTNKDFHAPAPVPDPAGLTTTTLPGDIVVQDTTWYLGNRTNDPYVESTSDYFTKYTFTDSWRDHDVHGIFADGSKSDSGDTFGAWLVMNTKDTYWGGPMYSDIIVDGIVYNGIVSNHHGDQTPNITTGFDRTIGPQFYFWNRGSKNATMEDLRSEAVKFASPSWNAEFYDSIAQHVVYYVPTSGRGSWEGSIGLPSGAKNPLAVLSASGYSFQDNVFNTTAYQYWADIDPSGNVSISRIKAGTYRLTVYADDIFGWYTQDGIEVHAGETTKTSAKWEEESAGTELWRIGTPDKTGGEWKHGNQLDPIHPNHPPEFRIYWGAYDFPTDFPNGVNFHVGEDKEDEAMNYIHWSVFGGKANFNRPEPYFKNVNNWTITFDLASGQLENTDEATFTIQLAGAKSAAGNTDNFNVSQEFNNIPYTVNVNGVDLEPWVIPYYQSSSCGVRSAVMCYNVDHKFIFDSNMLRVGKNEFILSLPANATDFESAILPTSIYVQYDALRLEIR